MLPRTPTYPRWGLAAGILFVLPLCLGGESLSQAQGQAPILEYDYSGSGSAAEQFRRVMRHRAVQELLLEIASAPQSRDSIVAALVETDVDADQLEELGLIRLSGDRYELSFTILTRADRAKIREVAETEGRRLANRIVARRAEVEAALRDRAETSGDWRALAYVILGCISLDWDGLELAEERGYLAAPREGEYLPFAWEPVPAEAVRELYWGSHNYTAPITFTTFGDHYSLPRSGLPDILRTLTSDAAEPVGPSMARLARELLRRDAGKVMLQLSDGAKTVEGLAEAVAITRDTAQLILDLLVDLRYVAESEGRYRAAVPVLTKRDGTMIEALRALGREAMEGWYQERFEALRNQLSGLTPQRYGIPLSDSYYWVWHYIFGVANRELVAASLFADPYDPEREFEGFIPMVIEIDVLRESE